MSDERDETGAGTQATDGRTTSQEGATTKERAWTEEVRVSGEVLVSKVKELLHEGNVRRITIKNDEGRTLIEIPLTIGVLGTLLLPVWAAIGAIAALAANLTLSVDRVEPPRPAGEPAAEPPANPEA